MDTNESKRVSDLQKAANRLNAKVSTGPRSTEGKARSAMNALKHGAYALQKVLPDETPEELEAFHDAMVDRLAPEGMLETLLAERVTQAAWRLRRAMKYEALIVEQAIEEQAKNRRENDEFGFPTAGADLARAVMGFFRHDSYENLARYERGIERGMYKALHELERLQARRNGLLVQPPAALDVDLMMHSSGSGSAAPQENEETNPFGEFGF